jgi:secondary thiamine-phosphate synthase enzyme
MAVETQTIGFSSRGFHDMKDITEKVAEVLSLSRIQNGTLTVFVPGSTGGMTTIEYEPGLEQDFAEMMERIIPRNKSYHHDARWGDGNGFSHVRASLLGPFLTIPVADGQMTLGTWQQIVFIDFDNRPRKRKLVVQVMGEK